MNVREAAVAFSGVSGMVLCLLLAARSAPSSISLVNGSDASFAPAQEAFVPFS